MTVHTHTPVLSVFEPRGLSARSVAFYRAQAGDAMDERVDRSAYDLAGRRADRWDARLWSAGSARRNVRSIHSLSGHELLNDSVDAGWRLELLGEGGDGRFRWDAKGQLGRVEYDDSLRPVAVFESDGASENCVERLAYGEPDKASFNQCGRLIRHDDPAGSLFNLEYGLGGEIIEQSRKFLRALDPPDWSVDITARDVFLESGDGSVSTWRFGPLGDAIEQTDAVANRQLFTQTVSGQLKSTRLQLKGQALQALVSGIRYDAQNRIEWQAAGNGVITSQAFDVMDGRLRHLRADNGRLQNLSYAYDPAGNVLSIEDKAQPTRFFANQQIEPLRTFTYDTLYQLVEATGYESTGRIRGPSGVQSFATADELSNYTQRYEYDAGGNLQKLIHTGARNHTRTFATALDSNRTLLQTGERPPTEEQIAAGFDANGNLRELSPGQTLRWDVRNQLSEVTPVERESGVNDREIYQYDADGARVRKVRVTQLKALTHLSEVRYLPGLEIRSNSATGEVLHVITVTAGRSTVRALHWEAGLPEDIDNDQIRYNQTDHLGSNTLEFGQDGQLMSQEVYYPYGETAWFAARSEVEATYKTVRYSGQERDATGLYYYGLRYYAPWVARWISSDPQGEQDGLNLFTMCRGNPVNYKDISGLQSYDVLNEFEMADRDKGVLLARGLDNFPHPEQQKIREALKLGISWIKSFREGLNKDSPSIRIILNKVMGPDHSEAENDPQGLKEELSDRFERIEQLMTQLSADESWRLWLTNDDSKTALAYTAQTAAQGKMIRLRKSQINENHLVAVAKTMVHESSHAVPTRNDWYTDDYWYLTSKLRTGASNDEIEKYLFNALRGSSVMLTGPDESSMNEVNRESYIRIIDGLLRDAGEPPSKGPEERKELFKTDPAVRQTITLRNADSLAVMALLRHRLN